VTSILGVDVSHYQPPTLPWREWVAGGLKVCCVQLTHVDYPEGNATAHLQAAAAAGVPSISCYHWLGGGGAKECRYFLSFLPAGAMWAMVDVEDPRATAVSLAEFCAWWDAHETRTLVLYGNNQLAAFVEARPELRKYQVWYAAYPTFPNPCTVPPFDKPRNVPASIAGQVIAWQYAGDNGRLPPYAGAIDLDIWYSVPGVTSPMTSPSTGCLIGFHTQGNSDAVPIAADYAAAGARIAIMLSDEDGGKAIDTQNTVKTRITRLQFVEAGDDHDFEGGGAGRLGWSEEKVNRYLAGIENMLTVRLGIGELNAATHLQLGCNEWDAQDVGEWLRTFDILARVVDKVNEVSARLIATKGLAHPLRLAPPAFNAGTPKTWAMYQAIAAHPIWPKLAAQGGCILFHEGIGFSQPFDWGENMPVEPGAPQVAGAGLVNFRAYNLLDLLAQRGLEIDWAVGEWYDGRKRADDVEARVDNLIRHDRLLAGSKWARRCLGYCTYELTNDPQSPWWEQDATQIWKHPRWKAYCVSVKDRINGMENDDMPQPLYHARTLIDLILRDASGAVAADPLAQSPDGHVVLKGTTLHIYQTGVTAGGFTNRATVTADGKSVWGIASAIVRI